jgi:glycine/D-amino acid oxidase-like deaminating enzyme
MGIHPLYLFLLRAGSGLYDELITRTEEFVCDLEIPKQMRPRSALDCCTKEEEEEQQQQEQEDQEQEEQEQEQEQEEEEEEGRGGGGGGEGEGEEGEEGEEGGG